MCESRGGRPTPAPRPTVLMVSVDVELHLKKEKNEWKKTELRSCVKVEVDVRLGFTSLIVSPHGLCERRATFEEE